MGVDGEAAGAFAEEGYFAWVAAEGVDVALYPVHGETLVEQAEISLRHGKFGIAWKAEDYGMLDSGAFWGRRRLTIGSVVGCHNDHVFVCCERAAIVCSLAWNNG